MNDEIKEYSKEQQKLKDYLDNVTIEQIIDKLKDDDGMTWWVDYQDKYQPNWKKLYCKEVILLLDYITNLQQENERLKEQCKEWKENHKAVCIQRDNILDNIVKNTEERMDYKSRNEKAVEYMNNTFNITSIKDMFDIMNKLEDILNGRSDE